LQAGTVNRHATGHQPKEFLPELPGLLFPEHFSGRVCVSRSLPVCLKVW
jgi:hypothetical protein